MEEPSKRIQRMRDKWAARLAERRAETDERARRELQRMTSLTDLCCEVLTLLKGADGLPALARGERGYIRLVGLTEAGKACVWGASCTARIGVVLCSHKTTHPLEFVELQTLPVRYDNDKAALVVQNVNVQLPYAVNVLLDAVERHFDPEGT